MRRRSSGRRLVAVVVLVSPTVVATARRNAVIEALQDERPGSHNFNFEPLGDLGAVIPNFVTADECATLRELLGRDLDTRCAPATTWCFDPARALRRRT